MLENWMPIVGTVLLLGVAPGLLALSLLPREAREALDLAEAAFLCVAVSVVASSWVALVLAEVGAFSLAGTAGVILLLGGAVALAASPRLSWPAGIRRSARGFAVLPVLAATLAFQGRPGEAVVGGRDPGVYLATMGLVARVGALAAEDEVPPAVPPEARSLFFPDPWPRDFGAERLQGVFLERPETGRVLPTFFHLFPALGALLFEAAGVSGALAASALTGILGTLSVFFALGRTLGAGAGLVGGLLLAVNVLQAWFSRGSYSETLSQFLLFLGIFAVALWEDSREAAFAALGGVALGMSLLCRVDNVLILVPLALYLAWRIHARTMGLGAAVPLLLPFGLLAAHAALHAALRARPYLEEVALRPYWLRMLGWTLFAAVAAAALARLLPRDARPSRLRAAAAAGVVSLAAYALLVRPALAGATGTLAEWSGFARLAPHDAASLVRLSWFTGAPALLLGVAGLALALRSGSRRLVFLLLVSLVYGVFYLYKARVSADLFFAMRRFVPVVLPALLGFAALALVRLARGGARRALLAGTLAVVAAWPAARRTMGLARHTEWQGTARLVRDVASRLEASDVLIVEPRSSLHRLSLPLWALHGVGVLELRSFAPEPEALLRLVAAWRGRHRVWLAYTDRLELCCVALRDVESWRLVTSEWERTTDRPPAVAERRELRFRLARIAGSGE